MAKEWTAQCGTNSLEAIDKHTFIQLVTEISLLNRLIKSKAVSL